MNSKQFLLQGDIMSFDYNPQQQTTSESEDLQSELQKIDALDKEMSKKPPVPLDEVGSGVIYYYKAIKIIILTYLIGYIASAIILSCIGTDYLKRYVVQVQLISELFIMFVLAIAAPSIFKSMECFCRTPSVIVPNAKLTIVNSWVIWFVAYLLSFFAGILIDNNPSVLAVVNTISIVLFGCSVYLFMHFLSTIGKICQPSKKGCQGAIIIMMIYYALSALATLIAGGSVENLQSSDASTNPALSLARLGGLMYIIGGLMYLSYFEKLNKFFKTKINFYKLDKENAKVSAFNACFIALVVFSVLGFIGYMCSVIPNMNNNAANNIEFQQIINDYDAKETKALNDWSSIFGQFNDQKMTDEQFDDWLVNTHIPAWKEALSILETSKENDNPSIDFLKTITQDRIAYCNSFHKALQQHSKELYKKAFQEFQRVDLKVLKLSYTDTASKDVLLQILHKAVVADDLETVKWAISNGVDVNEAIEGITPLHRARIMNLQNMIDFLKENGATE